MVFLSENQSRLPLYDTICPHDHHPYRASHHLSERVLLGHHLFWRCPDVMLCFSRAQHSEPCLHFLVRRLVRPYLGESESNHIRVRG